MANDHSAVFIDKLQEYTDIAVENAPLVQTISTYGSPVIGSSIDVPTSGAVGDYSLSTGTTATDITDTKVNIPISTDCSKSFLIRSVDTAKSPLALARQYLKKAVIGVVNNVNALIATKMIAATGTPIAIAYEGTMGKGDITTAQERLIEATWSTDYLAMSPDMNKDVLDLGAIDYTMFSQGVVGGSFGTPIGLIGGFKGFVTSNLKKGVTNSYSFGYDSDFGQSAFADLGNMKNKNLIATTSYQGIPLFLFEDSSIGGSAVQYTVGCVAGFEIIDQTKIVPIKKALTE